MSGLVTYDLLFAPPIILPPTGLTLASATPGRLDIELVQPTAVTLRFSFVEITMVEDDWTNPLILVIPSDNTHTAVEGVGGAVWVRARGADAWGHFSVYSDEETITVEALVSGTMWVPLLDGADGFVWLDHELIYVEVPTP